MSCGGRYGTSERVKKGTGTRALDGRRCGRGLTRRPIPQSVYDGLAAGAVHYPSREPAQRNTTGRSLVRQLARDYVINGNGTGTWFGPGTKWTGTDGPSQSRSLRTMVWRRALYVSRAVNQRGGHLLYQNDVEYATGSCICHVDVGRRMQLRCGGRDWCQYRYPAAVLLSSCTSLFSILVDARDRGRLSISSFQARGFAPTHASLWRCVAAHATRNGARFSRVGSRKFTVVPDVPVLN